MKNEEITWYKNRIIKLVKESEDLRLLKLIHRIAENLLEQSKSGKGGESMKQNEEVMEYKEELRQMIENIEDTDTIKYLRTFIKTFLKEWQ